MHELEQNIDHILLTEDQIQHKVREIAEQISKDYEGKQLLLVGILKGSMPFMAERTWKRKSLMRIILKNI